MDRSYESLTTVGIERKFRDLENRIMEDVVRRIRKIGEITSTADYQLNRYHILGNSTRDIEDIIKSAVGDDFPETFALYDKVIDKEYTRSKALYEQVNEEFIPFDQNPQMQQLANALIQQSNNELHNITKSMGFKIDMGNGKPVFTPLSDYYNQYLDDAMLDIASGAFDYNSVIRKVVNQMTNSGLRTVDYASGATSRCDVAARRAIMSGLTQLTGKISDTNAEKLHTDYFEIAWHGGARPTHRVWQGKVWSREELVTVCGLGTAGGLEGANCYHERYAYIPGISERQWSDGWLEEQNRKEDTPKVFKGKEYTLYDATQRQRYLETNMRAQRQKVKLLQEAGADSEEVMLAKCKYQAQLDEYKAFSKKMGLPEQRERIYYDMKGRVAPSKESYQAYLKGDTGVVDKSRLAQKTPKAAENWAKTHLGIKKTNYTSQPVEVVNMTNRALKRIYKENPILKDFVDEIEFKEIGAVAQASISIKGGKIRTKMTFCPSKMVNEKQIQRMINHEVSTGFWTNKKGLYGVAKHEGTHLSEYALVLKRYGVDKEYGGGDIVGAIKAIKGHEVSAEIQKEALKNCNLKDGYDIIKKNLCEYAAQNGAGEFLAEACSEYRPRKLAKEVQRLFREEMRK